MPDFSNLNAQATSIVMLPTAAITFALVVAFSWYWFSRLFTGLVEHERLTGKMEFNGLFGGCFGWFFLVGMLFVPVLFIVGSIVASVLQFLRVIPS